eukprot:CAMPEP_0206149158 /NCGR_PEP_ID=MMETSP1473-20131121/37628_1 /ASSEMBLY_ACC=CAM_ASM_001109 /TAXON_ID=1461547 /ORGANISM="Stichococcus sp, Strain RCC1054" /LENGTH=296 /DNA_ID=CAMNT_0053546607 /DNA_START=827 /DNA_END=1717 /DNA_ORIENTATION=+
MTFPKPPSDLLQPAPLNIRTCFRTGNSAPVARRSRLQLFPAHAEATDAINRDRVWPIPRDAEETAQEARAAVQRAWADGIKRQRVELLLPLIGATDLDDWPGGVRQQFKAVLPMVESMLTGLKAVDGLQGALNGEIWDQGDAVGAWQGKAMNVVVFPTGEVVKRMIQIEEKQPQSLLLMVNPQWGLSRQVVSDFGFFGRKKAEEFLARFEDTYFLKSYTIAGDGIRVLRSYPGDWQIHLVNEETGENTLVCSTPERPSYQLLKETIEKVEGSNSSKPLADRIRREIQFNQDSLSGK